MLLDEKSYPILYNHLSGILPEHQQHIMLAESLQFRSNLESSWRSSKQSPKSIEDVFGLYEVDDMAGIYGPVSIEVSSETEEEGEKMLDIWANTYKELAPVYRARKLIEDIHAKKKGGLKYRLQEAYLVDKLFATLDTAEQIDLKKMDAIGRRIARIRVDLESSHLADKSIGLLESNLVELSQSSSYLDYISLTSVDAESRAEVAKVVLSGLNEMFSLPQGKANSPKTSTAAILLSIFIFSVVYILVRHVFTVRRSAQNDDGR